MMLDIKRGTKETQRGMKEYFRFFKIPFILIGILAIITMIVGVGSSINSITTSNNSQSANTERTTTERVFDYADVLSDKEEDALREQIKESEAITKCDIVIVTLNESLVDYAASYEHIIGPVPTEKCVMVYADNFYDEHRFGYNKPYGDGVLFLDNWYRESDGGVYSWMCTTGKVENKYSSSMINYIMNESLEDVEDNPYRAYSKFIKLFVEDMTISSSSSSLANQLSIRHMLIFSVVITTLFFAINWSGKKGKKTVTNLTYVNGGNPTLKRKEDRFINKTVTKTKIESSSSSSGGGGHHRSSGGHSHGGGGHRR